MVIYHARHTKKKQKPPVPAFNSILLKDYALPQWIFFKYLFWFH